MSKRLWILGTWAALAGCASGSDLRFRATPQEGPAPLPVRFTWADDEDDSLQCRLNFGDGSPVASGACDPGEDEHIYTEPGTYRATLTMTLESSASDTGAYDVGKTLVIRVLEPGVEEPDDESPEPRDPVPATVDVVSDLGKPVTDAVVVQREEDGPWEEVDAASPGHYEWTISTDRYSVGVRCPDDSAYFRHFTIEEATEQLVVCPDTDTERVNALVTFDGLEALSGGGVPVVQFHGITGSLGFGTGNAGTSSLYQAASVPQDLVATAAVDSEVIAAAVVPDVTPKSGETVSFSFDIDSAVSYADIGRFDVPDGFTGQWVQQLRGPANISLGTGDERGGSYFVPSEALRGEFFGIAVATSSDGFGLSHSVVRSTPDDVQHDFLEPWTAFQEPGSSRLLTFEGLAPASGQFGYRISVGVVGTGVLNREEMVTKGYLGTRTSFSLSVLDDEPGFEQIGLRGGQEVVYFAESIHSDAPASTYASSPYALGAPIRDGLEQWVQDVTGTIVLSE